MALNNKKSSCYLSELIPLLPLEARPSLPIGENDLCAAMSSNVDFEVPTSIPLSSHLVAVQFRPWPIENVSGHRIVAVG